MWTTQPIRGMLPFGFAGAESMHYTASLRGKAYRFPDLRTLLAKASPLRSADELAGLAAGSEEERAVAQQVLADVPLRQFLEEPLITPAVTSLQR